MGTVAIEVETRRSGVETVFFRLPGKDMHTKGTFRPQVNSCASERPAFASCLFGSAGEVAPR